jgi:hypothetical protein
MVLMGEKANGSREPDACLGLSEAYPSGAKLNRAKQELIDYEITVFLPSLAKVFGFSDGELPHSTVSSGGDGRTRYMGES